MKDGFRIEKCQLAINYRPRVFRMHEKMPIKEFKMKPIKIKEPFPTVRFLPPHERELMYRRRLMRLPATSFPVSVPRSIKIIGLLGTFIIWVTTMISMLSTSELLNIALMATTSIVLTWIWIGIYRWARQESL